MLFSRLQQALGWQPANVGAVRDGWIRFVMESGGGRSTRVVREAPPAQQAGRLRSLAALLGEARVGPPARQSPGGATGKYTTSGGSSHRRARRLLSLCYDGGARGIPGRVTCRGRLRLGGVGLEQRHRVDRDGRDDRDDRVDDDALRRVGVVRGAAHLGTAVFTVVRREAR